MTRDLTMNSSTVSPSVIASHSLTSLDAGLYEKLKAMHFYDSIGIADVVNDAVRRAIAKLEAERGEPYEVPPPLRIDD